LRDMKKKKRWWKAVALNGNSLDTKRKKKQRTTNKYLVDKANPFKGVEGDPKNARPIKLLGQ